MIRSLNISPQPTARETRDILFRLGHDLRVRGARVDHAIPGGFRFHMPLGWNPRTAGFLHAVSSGRVTIGAALGEPWRVRYELRFSLLWLATVALNAVLVILGLKWHRTILLDLIAILWLLIYGVPYFGATRAFRRLIETAIRPTEEPEINTRYRRYSTFPSNVPAPSE